MMTSHRSSVTTAELALVALVLVLVPLAGCIGSDTAPDADPAADPGDDPQAGTTDGGNGTDDGGGTDGDDGDGSDGTGRDATTEILPSRLTYSGCTMHQAAVPVPPQAAGSAAEGFEPVVYDPTGTTVELRLVGYFCSNATFWTFSVDDTIGEFHAYLPVDPPDEYEDPDVDRYMVTFGSIVGREEIRSLRASWNLGSPELGDQSMTNAYAPSAPARAGEYSASSDSLDVTVHTTTQGNVSVDNRTLRIFGFEQGNLTDVVDWTVGSGFRSEGIARGVVQPMGTGQSELVGALAFNAAMTGEGWHTFGDGVGFEMVRRTPALVAG